MDVKATLKEVVTNRYVQVGAAAVIGAALGTEFGFRWSKERYKLYYSALAEAEIEEAKAFYKLQNERRVVVEEKPASPQDILAAIGQEKDADFAAPGDISEHLIAGDPRPDPATVVEQPEPKTKKHNVFDGKDPAEDEWDYDVENAQRATNPTQPYIIHHDEFFENESDHEQSQLTYYEGDDTLVDSTDSPIPDPDDIVGSDALVRFGHGSKDRNTVYVRNDDIEVDFEIVRSNQKFTVAVLDLDDEEDEKSSLRHSHGHGRRFRLGADD